MEKECWTNIGSGDKKAYSEVYVFYYKKLYNYGRKFTDDIAMIEDSIDEVFIMIWNIRQNLYKISSPQSYIFSSFRNNMFKKIKTLKKTQFYEIIPDVEIEFSTDIIIIKKETDVALQHQLKKALQQLTSRQREAVFLRFYEELSYIEIAGIMNISVKASYKIMARALHELKEILSIPMFLLLAIL